MVKPILLNKFVNSEKITLVDNEKTITNVKEIAKVLNDFFSNIIRNLNTDSIIKNVRAPTLKFILKYRKHPSILAIKRKTKSGLILTPQKRHKKMIYRLKQSKKTLIYFPILYTRASIT